MTEKKKSDVIKPDPYKYIRCPMCKSRSTYYRLRSKTNVCRVCGQVFYVNHSDGIAKPLSCEPRHVAVR